MTKSGHPGKFPTHPLKLKHVHEYVAASILASIVQALSAKQTASLASILGRVVYRRWHSRRTLAQFNLARAFPRMNESELIENTREIFRSSAQSFLEFARISKIEPTELKSMVHVDTKSRDYLQQKHGPVIFVSAHLGNWEYLGRWLAEHHGPIALLINPQTNPLVDRMIMRWRSHPKLHFVPYKNGWLRLSKMLQSGTSVALLADQRLESGGIELPFFGYATRWSKLPSLLAIRHQVPLVPVFLPRQLDGSFRMCLRDELVPNSIADIHSEFIRLTQCYIAACEQIISEYPGQYLFTHNRWGIDYNTITDQSQLSATSSVSSHSLQSNQTTPLSIQ